ncbi:MAG: hypothetical protein V3T33_05630 [Myxococcota bacterium]
MKALRAAVARAAGWLSAVYALDLEIDAASFVIAAETGRGLVEGPAPRSGIVAQQWGQELQLALYVDPRDQRDPGTIVEETSHLLCLAWHAAHDLPVSVLVLELQGEIDRFLFARHRGRDPFSHFERFRWADWLDAPQRGRYEVAHHAAHRYCRRLSRRFPTPADSPALLRELRDFYRASPQSKLRATAV